MWCFNRIRDGSLIQTEAVEWLGPFSWPGYEQVNQLSLLPDIQGVYLLTFQYHEGFILYAVGITKSTQRRFKEHTREYIKGNYSILDVDFATQGEREEIWHGWEYAKTHRDEFENNKDKIIQAARKQLLSFRVFTSEIYSPRKRERIESALMNALYLSTECWAELADRGMYLRGRYNSEIPVSIKNTCKFKIYGIPPIIEI